MEVPFPTLLASLALASSTMEEVRSGSGDEMLCEATAAPSPLAAGTHRILPPKAAASIRLMGRLALNPSM